MQMLRHHPYRSQPQQQSSSNSMQQQHDEKDDDACGDVSDAQHQGHQDLGCEVDELPSCLPQQPDTGNQHQEHLKLGCEVDELHSCLPRQLDEEVHLYDLAQAVNPDTPTGAATQAASK